MSVFPFSVDFICEARNKMKDSRVKPKGRNA